MMVIQILCIGVATYVAVWFHTRKQFRERAARKEETERAGFHLPKPISVYSISLVAIVLLLAGMNFASQSAQDRLEARNDTLTDYNAELSTTLVQSVMSVYNWLNGVWYAPSNGEESREVREEFISNSFGTFESEATLHQVLRTAKHLYEHQNLITDVVRSLNEKFTHHEGLVVESLHELISCDDRRSPRITRTFVYRNSSSQPCDSLLLPFGGEASHPFSEVNPHMRVASSNGKQWDYGWRDLQVESYFICSEHGIRFVPVSKDTSKRSRAFLLVHHLEEQLEPGDSLVVVLSNVWSSIEETSVVATCADLYGELPIDQLSMDIRLREPLLAFGVARLVDMADEEQKQFILDDTAVTLKRADECFIYSFTKKQVTSTVAFFFIQSGQITKESIAVVFPSSG
jgi:hypothetical protein